MNDCLFSQFKKQAQNNNLPYLGNVVLFCEVREGLSRTFVIETDGTKTHDLSVDSGDLVFRKGTGDVITKIIPPNTKAYYKESTTNSKFRVSEKYHVTKINGTRLGVDLNTIGGMSLLTTLFAEKSTLSSGDISNLKKLTGLTILTIGGDSSYPNTQINGDIQDLGTLTNLTSLTLRCITNITGDISVLNELESLTYLELLGCSKLSGSIQDLGNLTSVTEIVINGTVINGDGLELVKSLCSNGKTTGVLTVKMAELLL